MLYGTERELMQAYLEKKRKAAGLLSPTLKPLFIEFESAVVRSSRRYIDRGNHPLLEHMQEKLTAATLPHTNMKPSTWLKEHAANLLSVYLPAELLDQCLYAVDQITAFPYPQSSWRRTVRCASYTPQINKVFSIVATYAEFGYYRCSVADYLNDALSPELLDFKYKTAEKKYSNSMLNFENVIAASIDFNNQATINAIDNILTSDDNTTTVTYKLIGGIVKSTNRRLHAVLADFLVAARLQEGARQAVVECADEGRSDCFWTILHRILANDLVRFSAIKRAVGTWSGLYSESATERLVKKQLLLMASYLSNADMAQQALQSDDPIEVYLAIWSMGYWEVEVARSACKQLIKNGTRRQKIAAAFYCKAMTNWRGFCEPLARETLLKHANDIEVSASYYPMFLQKQKDIAQRCLPHSEEKRLVVEAEPGSFYLHELFESKEEAEALYNAQMQVFKQLGKKKSVRFDNSPFPGYSVSLERSTVFAKLAMTAFVLESDSKIDQLCDLAMPTNSGLRADSLILMRLPKTAKARQLLFSSLVDRAVSAQSGAFKLVKCITLDNSDFDYLKGMLRFKDARGREYIVELLSQQDDDKLIECISWLSTQKPEEYKFGAVALADAIKNNPKRNALFDRISPIIKATPNPSQQLQSMIYELCEEESPYEKIKSVGLGLYNPQEPLPQSPPPSNDYKGAFAEVSSIDARYLHACLLKLEETLYLNREREFTLITHHNTEVICLVEKNVIANGPQYYSDGKDRLSSLAFPEIWEEYYQTELKNPVTLFALILYAEHNGSPFINKLFSHELARILGIDYAQQPQHESKYSHSVLVILGALAQQYPYDKAFAAYYDVLDMLSGESKDLLRDIRVDATNYYDRTYSILSIPFVKYFSKTIEEQELDDRVFANYFWLKYRLFLKSGAWDIDFDMLCRAVHLNLVTSSFAKRVLFEVLDTYTRNRVLAKMGDYAHSYEMRQRNSSEDDCQSEQQELPELRIQREIYAQIADVIFESEINRGGLDSVFEESLSSIKYLAGADYFVRLLVALRDGDGLDLSFFYGRSTRTSSIGHLFAVCYPIANDTPSSFAALLEKNNVSETMLIEAGMYLPQWLNLIESYFDWSGLKSARYYFIAHGGDYLNDTTKAILERYTPLSHKELRNGAFDLSWFKDVYAQLGEKRFMKVYKSAKYLSSNNSHVRAQKFADAARGKVDRNTLMEQLTKKRNKDSLLSLGVIPIESETDTRERYEFIEAFRKESKRFGAQRRRSEGIACDMALKNLAQTAGYGGSSLRLSMAMEAKSGQALAQFWQPQQADDINLVIEADGSGKPSLICLKDDKRLKNLPSRLKTNETAKAYKEAYAQLRDQHQRTRKIFENAMEDEITFSYAELRALMQNPVICPIISALVFIDKQNFGFINEEGMFDVHNDQTLPLENSTALQLAHPYHLHEAGIWPSYQRYIFKQQIAQPFKQVFRELYLKLPEEEQSNYSLRFSGNQIQVHKAVACLKGRRWIVDYDNGLTRVNFSQNIIVELYAQADWFSPSEVEAPAIEAVIFSDRHSYKQLNIADVPPVIFSESMRDIDLVVSVAHVGEVDPETSHSTVEMRAIILQHTLALFKLDNVEIKEKHAIIRGMRADYSLNLGSGIVHQLGGAQLNILPIHAQGRGRLFLPFVDEDPKTAEIITKAIMLAQDGKIKDPTILRQINPTLAH